MKNATPKGKKVYIKKVIKQLEELFLTNYFKEEQIRIRKTCDIPDKGYKYSKELFKEISNNYISRYVSGSTLLNESNPDRLYIQKDILNKKIKSSRIKKTGKDSIEKIYTNSISLFKIPDISKREYINKVILSREITSIIDKIQIEGVDWVNIVIKSKILFSEIKIDKILENLNTETKNLCVIDEANKEYSAYSVVHTEYVEDGYENEIILNEKELQNLFNFPVSIRIHPMVSQRNVIDFIKGNWKYIEKLQSEYIEDNDINYKKSKTVRNKKTKKIKEVILKNPNASLSKIKKTLEKKGVKEQVSNISKYRKALKKGL